MKALVHTNPKGMEGMKLQDVESPKLKKGEVKVQLKVAGLNHRDLFVLHRHGEEDPPFTVGSDGAGVIVELGEGVEEVSVGDEVVINPGLHWATKSPAPPEGFDILGFPSNGTFAEEVIVPAAQVEQKPEHLNWTEAGVLPLAALTAYRALFTRGNVQEGQHVLLPGVGSGVITFILQYAKAVGAKVTVTSRSEEKRNEALKLGADKAIDSDSDWENALDGEQVDLVIESVGAATFDQSLKVVKKGGTVVTFGASAGDEVSINIRNFFYGQYNLLGTTMGSHEEFKEMLAFIKKYNIKPVVDQIYSLEDWREGFNRMEEAKQFGKIAFKISE
ncbi:zinc-binding dehydrogenase [Pseudalkalibacillus berkeleyi]|uniref:Zinc-binding dehydrogenase n=1 Tax=Pseudalkalibacillus berkeleyi TaxID=1069813 RepID=A0ABS9GXQ4_9BACL|nr:zinc-binding dehydrogenase [Pseudalkalibacillus berkeleyi]MCF6136312.1 zinc-binding dehydrogenase [Pseudalkalibacillus berkeleyi]